MAHETDSNLRAKEGVVICLRDVGDGSSLLIFDDVVADDLSGRERAWRHKVFYTHTSYNNGHLDHMELSDQQFREIGEVVVARLLAINGRIK